jgi:hypothetical protein
VVLSPISRLVRTLFLQNKEGSSILSLGIIMGKIITLKECLKLNFIDERSAEILFNDINTLLKQTNWEITQSVKINTYGHNEKVMRYVYSEIDRAGWTCNIYETEEYHKRRIMAIFRTYPDLDSKDY